MKKRTFQFLISFLISIVVAVMYVLFSINNDSQSWSFILSNAGFVNAVLFGGVWGLSYISSDGLFDIFGYSFKRFGARIFHKNPKYTNVPKTFYEYRELKHEDGPAYINYLGWVALFWMIMAVLFLILNKKGL